MKLKESSTLQRTSNYEVRLIRPNPPSAEMVRRAKPFRADVINLEAIIKHPTIQIDV
jgi:hypothetical protein